MLKRIIAIGLPLFILILAFFGMKGLMSRKPVSQQKEKQSILQPVKVVRAQTAPSRYRIESIGRTMAAHQVILQPQVSGLVKSLNTQMSLGGLVEANAPLLEIDKSDYQLAVRQAEAQVGQADVRLREEQGRSAVALHEWNLLQSTEKRTEASSSTEPGRALALRKPQLRSAQLNLEAAKASLAQARLALKRTTLLAPMNSVIVRKTVDVGQKVSPNQSVGTLVGTDTWWIQVSLSPTDLERVTVPDVKISVFAQNIEQALEARVIRTLPDVDNAGKLIRLLIGVDDPMRLENEGTPLFLGDSVNVYFDCPTPSGLVRLPRKTLRAGGYIWRLVDEQPQSDGQVHGKIEFVKPSVFYKSQSLLLVNGLNEGSLIVNSNLSMATKGTQVRWTEEGIETSTNQQPAREPSAK